MTLKRKEREEGTEKRGGERGEEESSRGRRSTVCRKLGLLATW